MNIENLKMFCRVMEEGNISRAARMKYVSQTAVVKQICQLKVHYNTLLFNRQDGKLISTKAGETLHPFAKNTAKIFECSYEAVKGVYCECDIVLRIGESFTIGDYLLPSIMGCPKQLSPDYQFNLV